MNFEFESVYCRLCGGPVLKTEAVDLFRPNNYTLKFIILVRLQIQIPLNDQYSKLLCHSCVNRLENFHSFSKKCFRTQMQLAQCLDTRDFGIKKEEDDDSFCRMDSESEDEFYMPSTDVQNISIRPQFEITAENCDNIIIPEIDMTNFDEKKNLSTCDGEAKNLSNNVISESDVTNYKEENNLCIKDYEPKKLSSIIICDESNFNEKNNLNMNDGEPKKLSLSKLKLFFRSKIQWNKNRKTIAKDNESESPTSNQNMSNEPTSSKSTRSKFKESQKSSFKKRIPPRVNQDDIKCPYCSWFIPKHEFESDHLPLHMDDLNSELHNLIMIEHQNHILKMKSVAQSPIRCSDCDESFPNKLLHLEHRNVHLEKKAIKCHLCGSSYISRKRLRVHMCSVHLERLFKCDKCTYRSKSASDLRKHLEAVHTGAQIMCPLCGKLIAAYPHNLKKHLDTHNEVPTYKCKLCPAAYRTKTSLAKHRENKHFPIPVMCSLCGTQCASKQKYKKHIMKCKKRCKMMEK